MLLLFARRLAAILPPVVVPAPLRGVVRTTERAAPFVLSQESARAVVTTTDVAAPAILAHHTVRLRRGI